jgi:hypothetical protein
MMNAVMIRAPEVASTSPRTRRFAMARVDIDQNAAEHLSITFSGGPRLDLFVYPQGSPVRSAPMHPHIALTVSPRRFLEWKRRLECRGVVVSGPTRPGPPARLRFISMIPSATIWSSSHSGSLHLTYPWESLTARGSIIAGRVNRLPVCL